MHFILLKRYVVAWGFLWLLPFSSFAAIIENVTNRDLPATETADYRLSWLNVPFGQAHAQWEENATGYTARFSLKTTGVAAVFSPQAISLSVSGGKDSKKVMMTDAHGVQFETLVITYRPSVYHFVNERSEKHKETTITYDAAGHVAKLEVTPEDKDRPAVSAAGRDAAYDPLSILIAFNGLALAPSGTASLDMFDGSRLAHLTATRDGAGYAFRRGAIEGFTAKEKKRLADEPRITATLDPAHSRFPRRMVASLMLGSMKIERVGGK